ncbi:MULTISPECIES: MHYT domain-containing protein [unclassified Oleiphilus]|nr:MULTISPECIES: MHYT domain-containing protein [unclassified Oleiphilus]
MMEFWRFSELNQDVFEPIAGSYDVSLVVWSVLFAVMAAMSMLTIVERSWRKELGRHEDIWMYVAAVVMGCGVWAMHFTGMHAFHLETPVHFDLGQTLLSIVPALLGSYVAISILAKKRFDVVAVQMGGLAMAAGIGLMHYIGMEAMHLSQGGFRYDPLMFVFSIVVAHLLAVVAIYTHATKADKESSIRVRFLSAVFIGAAVSAMHYVAMVASEFYVQPENAYVLSSQPHEVISWNMITEIALFLGASLVGVLLGTRLDSERRKSASLMQRENAVISSLADALLVLNEQGDVDTYNVSAQRLFGAEHSPIETKNILDLIPELGSFAALEDWEHSDLERGASGLTLQFSTYSDAGTNYYEVVFSRLFFNESLHYVAMIRDITARMIMEQQLRQAQKLESIGQLAAGIAHEINTPIQYVSDNMSFMKKASGHVLQAVEMYRQIVSGCCDENSKQQVEDLEKMLKKAKFSFITQEIPKSIDQSLEGLGRVSTIVRAMKSFSHASEGNFSAADVKEALESTTTICRNEWKYLAHLKLDIEPDIPPVQLILDEFNQVILNLVVNAAHAIEDRLKAEQSSDLGQIDVIAKIEAEFLRIDVRDNGCGIPKEIQERVFEPFFTTKAVGKGTGQGLNIAYSVIVEKHKGRLELESTMGEGSCFSVFVPLKVSQPEASLDAEKPA